MTDGSGTRKKRGHRPPNSAKMDAKRLALAEKRRDVVKLRVRGRTFEQIATELGLTNRSVAWKMFEAAVNEVTREDADQAFEMTLERCNLGLERMNTLIVRNMPLALGGNGGAARIVVDAQHEIDTIEHRRARLQGLYAPVKLPTFGGESGKAPSRIEIKLCTDDSDDADER